MDSLGGIKDQVAELLPIPHTTDPVTDPLNVEMLTDSTENPTLSHTLANAAVEAPEMHTTEKGAAQVDHDEEVVDLGWNSAPAHVESPLVGGMKNEDLWVLVRRFNKVSSRFQLEFGH